MKKVFAIVVCFSLMFFVGRSQTSFGKAATNYSLTRENGIYTLILEYSMSGGYEKTDTAASARNIFEEYFGKNSAKGTGSGLSHELLKSELLELMKKQGFIVLQENFPDYMEEIFALMNSRKKRNKARAIYRNRHSVDLINDAVSHQLQYENKVMTRTQTSRFTFRFRAKKDGRIEIPAYVLDFKGQKMLSQSLALEIRKS